MSGRKVAGLVLVAVGVVILLWGGVFWTDRDTIVDAGDIELTRQSREGIAVPPIVGGVVLVAGILLVLLPQRRRA